MLAAGLVELAVRLLVDELVVEEFPQVHELHEVRGLVAELFVGTIRRFAQCLRPVARIGNRERRGDDEHLG